MSQELYTALINTVVTLLVTVITAAIPIITKFVIDWLKAKEAKLWDELNENQRWMINQTISMAVSAAKQAGLDDVLKSDARTLEEKALSITTSWLARYDVHLDAAQTWALIKAEIAKQINPPVE